LIQAMLRCLLLFVVAATAFATFPDCDFQKDGHYPHNGTMGPYGPVANFTGMWEDHPVLVIYPTGSPTMPLPLFSFMHGSTGAIGMYGDNLRIYASHGFVVVFPYVKDPKKDQNPLTTNTDGEFILKSVAFANFSSVANASSPIFGMVDMTRIVLAGHSMGASCSIAAGHRAAVGDPRVPKSSVKLVSTQHPGICGPFGPPPWPSTWLESELHEVVDAFPMIFTTATNDGAFWPAPYTAEHELGCFQGGVPENSTTHPATFVQYDAVACNEDGMYPPWTDSGHDCPFKTGVEAPWVLTAAKLYAQQDGNMQSECAKMLYGSGEDSLSKDAHVKQMVKRSWPAMQ